MNFFKKGNKAFNNGLFNGNQLVEMSQASDHKSVNKISPFYKAIVDLIRENNKCLEVTTVFFKYVDLFHIISRENSEPC